MTNVYGSANISKELIKYHHIHFLILKHNAKLKMSTFSFVRTNSLQAVLNRFIPLTTTVHESASDTYTLTQLKGTIDRYSSKTVVL